MAGGDRAAMSFQRFVQPHPLFLQEDVHSVRPSDSHIETASLYVAGVKSGVLYSPE